MTKIYVLTDVPKGQVAQIIAMVVAAGGKADPMEQPNGLFTIQSTYGAEAGGTSGAARGLSDLAFAGRDAGAPEPAWMAIARGEIGVKEVPGTGADKSNPRIEEYFTWTTHGKAPDHVPWCGAFVSFCLGKAGIPIGKSGNSKGSALASDWLQWGKPVATPLPGCVVVLKPLASGASGHVGFFVKVGGGQVHLLAGNQSDAVNITPYPLSYVRDNGYRWPA
jgi:uncharacterized protein (TIGR02594 family)